jgi:hypothetical protein
MFALYGILTRSEDENGNIGYKELREVDKKTLKSLQELGARYTEKEKGFVNEKFNDIPKIKEELKAIFDNS